MLAAAAATLGTGCGGNDSAGGIKAPKGTSQSEFERQLETAQTVTAADFPATKGRTLQTEPWLFTFDRAGRVAARLEGSFGTRAFEQAIEDALR